MAAATKMTIVGYEKGDFSGPQKGPYVVCVNPEKYTQSYTVSYDKSGPAGSSNTSVKFDRSRPATMKFELLFDGTGVVENGRPDVAADIAAFQNVVYAFDGEIHSPTYLKITWGTMSFGARLTEMTVNYTLFRGDGAPLRARADVAFVNYVDAATIKKKEGRKSPDLTRQVQVRAGDTLPLLTYRTYGDKRFYLEVARHNKLTDFRHLPPGLVLTFPPLS